MRLAVAGLLAGGLLLSGCRPAHTPVPEDLLRSTDPVAPTSFQVVDVIESRRDAPWGPISSPAAVAVLPDARFFLADSAKGIIHHFDRDGLYVGGLDGPSNLVPIDLVEHGLLLFVLDAAERRVLRFTADGVFRDVFLDVRQLTRRNTIDPSAVAIDRDGRVAVADARNHEVLVTGPFLDLDVVVAEWGSFDGQVDTPVGVAFGLDGILYVADRGNRRVQAFDRNGVFLLGTRSIDEIDPQLIAPTGIACDRWGNVYVADTGGQHVVVFSPDLQVIARIGTDEFDDGRLRRPVDCAIGPDDRLYVADDQRKALVVYEIVYP